MILNHKVHVLTRKEELDTVRLAGKVVIVLDVLFATTTMVAALANGATEVLPAIDGAAARAIAAAQPEGSYVIAGELHSMTLDGCAPPTPLALLQHGIAGRKLIYSTTNGTVALHACAEAPEVYVGALLNARALVQHVLQAHPDHTVLVVCAGSVGNFNLEDFLGAGCFVDLFANGLGERIDLSDAARAARMAYRSGALADSLMQSRVGRMMIERGEDAEVRYSAQCSVVDVIARYAKGAVRPVA